MIGLTPSFFIPVIFNAIGWSVKPVLEKMAVSHIPAIDFAFIFYMIAGVISLVLWIISLRVRKINYKKIINKQTIKQILYWGPIVAIVSILSLIPQYYLLSRNEACRVIGIVEATTALFGVILAKIILKERMSFLRWFGVFAIVVGIISLDSG